MFLQPKFGLSSRNILLGFSRQTTLLESRFTWSPADHDFVPEGRKGIHDLLDYVYRTPMGFRFDLRLLQ